MSTESWYTIVLLAGGAALGALAMRYSMKPSVQGHVKLGKHLMTAGAGIAVGAGAMHMSESK